MPVKDYYTILGVTPVATLDEIRRAWRALAQRWHPDKNPGNEEATARFTEIKEAYEVLTNPEKKQRYLEERWLAGFHAQGFDTTGPPTAENMLKQVLLYEKQVFSQDVFRMNKHAATAGAVALLDDGRLELLLQDHCGEIRIQAVYALLRISERLPASLSGGLFSRISRLAGGDNGLERQVRYIQQRQLRRYRWQRYNWMIALAAALLLTLLLWLLAGRD